MVAQCRYTYLEESVPVSLEDLHTVEFGDWQAYMNGCMAALIKETKDKYVTSFIQISNISYKRLHFIRSYGK